MVHLRPMLARRSSSTMTRSASRLVSREKIMRPSVSRPITWRKSGIRRGWTETSHLELLPLALGPLHGLAEACLAADVVQVPIVLREKWVIDHPAFDCAVEP